MACNKGPQDAVPSKETETMAKYKKGYQLYTIREELTNDSMLSASLISRRRANSLISDIDFIEIPLWLGEEDFPPLLIQAQLAGHRGAES